MLSSLETLNEGPAKKKNTSYQLVSTTFSLIEK